MLDADHAGETCRRRQPHWYSLNVAKFHTAAHLELGSELVNVLGNKVSMTSCWTPDLKPNAV